MGFNLIFTKEKRDNIKQITFEMKNALNGISGFLELLDRCLDSCEQHALLSRAKHSYNILFELVKAMDRVILSDNYYDVCRYARLNLKALLIDALMEIKKRALEKSIEIKFDFDDNIPLDLFGNNIKLYEIISALLENALVVTNSGQISFTVKLITVKKGVASIYFEIIDGKKLDPIMMVQDKFVKYMKEGIGPKTEDGCSKICLALSQENLKVLNSCLNISTEEDVGTKVYFTLDFIVY